ncbi:amidohydrolase [Opitutales bacterium ASA1]|uniref:amidohydrolase family protein n=1 Tax=Congregicoccus parvus TaxID=3081749 RepID=UPI002B2E81B9|nr:amidohydrolase [Opitutales bacterium ASA1]
MHLVDTHQHLWDLEQLPYSWTDGIEKLRRSFRFDDYLAAAANTGITKTVFMECDVDEPHALAEARHVQGLAETEPLICGIVASGRPEQEGFADHLDALSELPKLRGLRRILHTRPDALSQSSLFREHIRMLAGRDLTFDLCLLARQLPVGMDLVRACPDTTFILDHCGVPDVKSGVLSPWREYIREFAALPNVAACKISGIVAYADPGTWTTEDLRFWFEHVIECFGWDRVVWGGDWPVCTLSSSLARWVETTRTLTAGASESERARLFHLNAERIYRV